MSFTDDSRGRGRRDKSQDPRYCAECDDVLKTWHEHHGRPPKPVHCVGSSVAWHHDMPAPHHYPAGAPEIPACWRCHRPGGCVACNGPVTEAICRTCRVWITPEALAWHGALQADIRTGHRVEVEQYPAHFQPEYRRFDDNGRVKYPRGGERTWDAEHGEAS